MIHSKLAILSLVAILAAAFPAAAGPAVQTPESQTESQAARPSPEAGAATLLPMIVPVSPKPLVSAIERVQSFIYEFSRPEKPGGRTIVLLHGSGGDETTLMALARKIAPDATLIGVRGRVRQEGINRWYSRITPTSFDQSDIRAEAEAFAASIRQKLDELKLSMNDAIFLGYSNGANLIGAMSMMYPKLVHRAVLLRAMPVLEEPPAVELSDIDLLTIAGRGDKVYGPFAPKLEDQLRKRGARVKAHLIDSGHEIGEEDARLVREWLMAARAD